MDGEELVEAGKEWIIPVVMMVVILIIYISAIWHEKDLNQKK